MHGCGSVAHRAVHFGGGRRVETFRDDHAVVGPVLDDHRPFLGHRSARSIPGSWSRCRRARAARSRCDSAARLRWCRSARNARRPAESSIAKHTEAPDRPWSPLLRRDFVLAMERHVSAALPRGRNIVRILAFAVLLQKRAHVELPNAARVVHVVLLARVTVSSPAHRVGGSFSPLM